MENKILNSQVPNQDNFLINPELQKKRQQRKIVYLVMAIILVIGSALGSYFLSKNLNRADVPNAPSSQPQAAGKKQVTNNTKAERCTQGCASDEYCDNTRCRKIGGNADGRNDAQKAWDSIVVATPTLKGEGGSSSGTGYEAIPGYVCTDANCNSGFHCLNGNTCVNDKNANLSVANDPENCGGTASKGIGKVCKVNEACVGGKCVTSGNTCNTSGEFVNCDGARSHCVLDSSNVKRCVPLGESTNYANSLVPIVYVTPIVPTGDKKNCGGNVCSPTQVCIANECTSEGVTGTDNCMYKNPYNGDGGGSIRECCVQNIGVIPVGLKNGELYNNEIIVSDTNRGTTDTTWHWTHCAPGTSCQQGVGCIGSGTKTPEKTTTEITTVTTVTTTVTATPSITVTTTPTATPTATITVTVTSTPSGTVTTTPTPATCNESCGANSDCASGLFCDSNSNKCRKAECSTESSCVCPTATPEPTIVGCNKRCNEDSNCMEGLICDTGSSNRCRRPSCMSAYDCRCQKISTPTTPPTEQITNTRRVAKQPERLVESGVLDLPGVVTFGGGLILTIVGILLAL